MAWKLTPNAIDDYLSLCRRDPRWSRTDRELLIIELRDECERLAATKTGKPRDDGLLIYRGRASRRYQYLVDSRTGELVQVRGESGVREQGPPTRSTSYYQRRLERDDPHRSGPSIPNEQRARPLITMTMSREAVADLDARRGEISRGGFVEELLRRSQFGR